MYKTITWRELIYYFDDVRMTNNLILNMKRCITITSPNGFHCFYVDKPNAKF